MYKIKTTQNLRIINSIRKTTRLLKQTNSNIVQKRVQNLKITEFDPNFNLQQLYQKQTIQNIKLYIKTTLNNIFVTIVTPTQILTQTLAALGFKGKAHQTIYAYKMLAEKNVLDLTKISKTTNILHLNIYVNTLNSKLKPFLKIYNTNNIQIQHIYDITPIPYNGCRKKKIAIKKKKKSVIKYLSYR